MMKSFAEDWKFTVVIEPKLAINIIIATTTKLCIRKLERKTMGTLRQFWSTDAK